jgi:hypothetical protein
MDNKLTNEDLGRMIKEGFDEVDSRFKVMGKQLDDLKQGQEDIKLRLDNVAYRFELVARRK